MSHPNRGILWTYPPNAVIPAIELLTADYRTEPNAPPAVCGLIREGEPSTYPIKGDLLWHPVRQKTPIAVTNRSKDGKKYKLAGVEFSLTQLIDRFEYYPCKGDTVLVNVGVWDRWLASQLTPELRGVGQYPSREYSAIQAKLETFADRRWICSEFVVSLVGKDGLAAIVHSSGEGRDRVPVGCLSVLRKYRG